MITRVLEITSCGECPHLDTRWQNPPWDCSLGWFSVRVKDKIPRRCPLMTKKQYIEAAGEP